MGGWILFYPCPFFFHLRLSDSSHSASQLSHSGVGVRSLSRGGGWRRGRVRFGSLAARPEIQTSSDDGGVELRRHPRRYRRQRLFYQNLEYSLRFALEFLSSVVCYLYHYHILSALLFRISSSFYQGPQRRSVHARSSSLRPQAAHFRWSRRWNLRLGYRAVSGPESRRARF